ncbi:mannose-1-phosphate guanylyltransferase [Aliidiomarina minuta]|uniref:Mannose-1-phosphate guanylyltransferase n=1 Tax=Aliidiomarina minuta TaxID=880057 RepID=A0A432W497_9GAMM|nr:nucleotidyltransferase family protein [Aliidiomarina minuta]RUO24306.1 mannose-1-phosphate guanylyltransferase [Aliidiomarina minuta]
MRAMILAAGRGQRMRPLTDNMPKPLLPVAGKPLIDYHLEKLARAGVKDVVINHAWQGASLHQHIGNGQAYGLNVAWSAEPEGGLETAGGIIKALPLLGDEPFWVINGDVWTDYAFSSLPTTLDDALGHLILVTNPQHNQNGDFQLAQDRVELPEAGPGYTFSGLSLLSPQLFAGYPVTKLALKPLFLAAIQQQQLQGSVYNGQWTDVGTPQRLEQLSAQLLAQRRQQEQ